MKLLLSVCEPQSEVFRTHNHALVENLDDGAGCVTCAYNSSFGVQFELISLCAYVGLDRKVIAGRLAVLKERRGLWSRETKFRLVLHCDID